MFIRARVLNLVPNDLRFLEHCRPLLALQFAELLRGIFRYLLCLWCPYGYKSRFNLRPSPMEILPVWIKHPFDVSVQRPQHFRFCLALSVLICSPQPESALRRRPVTPEDFALASAGQRDRIFKWPFPALQFFT
jgi:hypothetical protein